MPTHLEDLVGAKLVIGFPGTKITSDVVKQFRDLRAGGVIFYRINFDSPNQLKSLIKDLEEALQRKLLVCVDHEGGRVIMYRDGVTIFPDNWAFGRTGNPEYAREAGRIAAQELRALGTDVDFAPTIDVVTSDYSPNIGIRSFGGDPNTVAAMGVAYIEGMQAGGVSATAKHFPGSGAASIDAHLNLPTIGTTWDEMNRVHLPPFAKAIAAGVDVVMSSHPFYPRLDPHPQNIATFSRRIITDCLRDEMAFKGVISSDDLEMGAIRDICPIDVAAVRTVAAGHDLVLSCHDLDAERQVFLGLLDAYKSRFLPLRELEQSAERIEVLRSKRTRRFEGDVGPDAKGPALALRVAREGLEVIQDAKRRLPLQRRTPVPVIFPKLSGFASRIMIEKAFEDEAAYIRQTLETHHAAGSSFLYDIDPTEDEIAGAAAAAGRGSPAVLFLFDAHLHSGQKRLLEAVQQSAPDLIVGLLRCPYDRAYLRPADTGLTAFGFRKCQVDAVMERIFAR